MWCYHPFLQNKFARAYVQMVGMTRKRKARENMCVIWEKGAVKDRRDDA